MHDTNIIINYTGEVAVLEIHGNILQESVDTFRNKLNYLLECGKTMMVLNLTDANYMSSLCLAVIIDVKLKLKKVNGDLKLAAPNHLIRNLMEITNLVKQFELYDTVNLAVKAFNEN